MNAEQFQQQYPEWSIVDGHHLERTYRFPDFKTALAFVNQVGDVAEAQGHHPNIEFTWGKVSIRTFTHDIDGLSGKDYVLAAAISDLQPRKG